MIFQPPATSHQPPATSHDMIPLFLGLTLTNLAVLGIAFGFGFTAVDVNGEPTGLYNTHLLLGFAAGVTATLTHVVVFTYFMATTKWLGAATDKAGVSEARFLYPSVARKRKAFFLAMSAVGLTMITLFAGAGADPTMTNPLWPGAVHLMLAGLAIAGNLFVAFGEYALIAKQGRAIDDAAALLNADASPDTQAPVGVPGESATR